MKSENAVKYATLATPHGNSVATNNTANFKKTCNRHDRARSCEQEAYRMSTTYPVPGIQSNYSSTEAAWGRNSRLPNPI